MPIRTCRGCRRKAAKHELSRFVVEQGCLVEKSHEGGYGFYCCPDQTCRDKMQMKLLKQKIVRADKVRGRE